MAWLAKVDGRDKDAAVGRIGTCLKSDRFAVDLVTSTCKRDALKVMELFESLPRFGPYSTGPFEEEKHNESVTKMFEEAIPDAISFSIHQAASDIVLDENNPEDARIISMLVEHFQKKENRQTWTIQGTNQERAEVLETWLQRNGSLRKVTGEQRRSSRFNTDTH